jgi:hypothetical protein
VIIIPIKECSEDGKNGFKWGDSGKCYLHDESEAGMKAAKEKAVKQGLAEGGGELDEIEITKINAASEPTYEYLKKIWDILKERPEIFEEIKEAAHKTARASAGGQMKAKYARELLETNSLHFNAAEFGGSLITFDDNETVIPVVLQAEGVRNGALQRFEDFAKEYRWYEGVPVVPEHKPGDPPVSHKTNKLGQIRNVRLNEEKKRIEAEAVLFNSKFIQDDLERIKAGESFPGSIGFYADDEPMAEPQTWLDGQTYNRIEKNFFGDHFSIVASPACPLGKCGFNVNTQINEVDEMTKVEEGPEIKANTEIKPVEAVPAPQVNVAIDLSTVLTKMDALGTQMAEIKTNMATKDAEIAALKATEEVRVNAQKATEDKLIADTVERMLLPAFKDQKDTHTAAFKANAALWMAQNTDKIDFAAFAKSQEITPAGQAFVPHVNAADEDPFEKAGEAAAESLIVKPKGGA